MDPTEKTKRNHQEIPLDFADLAMTIWGISPNFNYHTWGTHP
jgi:hypothetical protein